MDFSPIDHEDLRPILTELDRADDQLACGEFTEYDETGIHDLVERVISRGQERLAGRKIKG